MKGPYSLTTSNIGIVVTRKSPGVYILYVACNGQKLYVGRSDTDVRARLKRHVGERSPTARSAYSYFKFDYATSPKKAFERECNLWHYHRPPDNLNHPQRPAGTSWKCPRCKIFG